jgi:hypothetical protein
MFRYVPELKFDYFFLKEANESYILGFPYAGQGSEQFSCENMSGCECG